MRQDNPEVADEYGGSEPKQDTHCHVSSCRPQGTRALPAEADVLHDKDGQRAKCGNAQQRRHRCDQRPQQPGPR